MNALIPQGSIQPAQLAIIHHPYIISFRIIEIMSYTLHLPCPHIYPPSDISYLPQLLLSYLFIPSRIQRSQKLIPRTHLPLILPVLDVFTKMYWPPSYSWIERPYPMHIHLICADARIDTEYLRTPSRNILGRYVV